MSQPQLKSTTTQLNSTYVGFEMKMTLHIPRPPTNFKFSFLGPKLTTTATTISTVITARITRKERTGTKRATQTTTTTTT